VEADIDRWDLEPRTLVSAERPSDQALMLGIGAEDTDRVGDDHGSRPRLYMPTAAGERRGRQDQDQEPRCDLRVQADTVAPGSCEPIAGA
jgi:hypothetical protein